MIAKRANKLRDGIGAEVQIGFARWKEQWKKMI